MGESQGDLYLSHQRKVPCLMHIGAPILLLLPPNWSLRWRNCRRTPDEIEVIFFPSSALIPNRRLMREYAKNRGTYISASVVPSVEFSFRLQDAGRERIQDIPKYGIGSNPSRVCAV